MDANLLLYAYNEDSPRHEPALMFLTELAAREDVAISELVLTEFYTLPSPGCRPRFGRLLGPCCPAQ
jgi:predicted nucleic acid-binding protein